MAKANRFLATCKCLPIATDLSPISKSETGAYDTTAHFTDSSGRVSLSVPIELSFSCQSDLDEFLSTKSLHPDPNSSPEGASSSPANDDEKQTERDSGGWFTESESAIVKTNNPSIRKDSNASIKEEDTDDTTDNVFGFEINVCDLESGPRVAMEQITVTSTSVQGLVVRFDSEIVMQVLALDNSGMSNDEKTPTGATFSVEITPILVIRDVSRDNLQASPSPNLLQYVFTNQAKAIPPREETRLPSFKLDISMTRSFFVETKSIAGPSSGTTLLAVSIKHSNSHSSPVSITNIALHLGHSQCEYDTLGDGTKVSHKGLFENMTKFVKWEHVPTTDLSLPIHLDTHDRFSTVIAVTAEEESSRGFVSSLSVTGTVGSPDDDSSKVVVATEARWLTSVVAVEPADAFRIDMHIGKTEVKLGATILVTLSICNLSLDTKNLMILIAKEESNNINVDPHQKAANSAVVSENDSYTFGVWGLSTEDNGSFPLHRDNDLLAVDAALLLGDVTGQHETQAELRFVPLKEGVLKVPNFRLFDRSNGQWYSCAHNLRMLASA